jgi:tight adherence protein C
VNPYLPASALLVCVAVAARAVVMIREKGPLGRFEAAGAGEIQTKQPSALLGLLDSLADRVSGPAMRALGERRLERLRRRLDAAGRPGGLTLDRYAGKKALYVCLFGAAGVPFALRGDFVTAVLLFVFGSLWLDAWLFRVSRQRQSRIDRDLPDFLDILAVTVGAGVGFTPALRRVSDALGGPLAEEINTALRQMDLGASRREAFLGLRRRTDSEYLNQFVTALLQAEELGVPLADALTHLASDMRAGFYQEARRRAARAAPRVSVITSIIVMPASVILIIAALLIGSNVDVGGVLGGG